MAERLNAHDSKSCDAGMYPRVQIPLSAPQKRDRQTPVPFLYASKSKKELENIIVKWYNKIKGILYDEN